MIYIYNTLIKKKVVVPVKKIIIYSCGITVYDFCHIGHARIFIFFDVFVRFLNQLGYKIILIRNITDIDDKIIFKATKLKKSIKKISDIYMRKMHINIFNLKLYESTYEPKATTFIGHIINLIILLNNKGYAYKGFNSDIYYFINCNGNYGRLSGRILNKSRLGIKNIGVVSKNFDLDFALWKIDDKFWPSPWGRGRPGWHSECAAMNLYYADNNYIDIHSGGRDLLFPHHENELAQFDIFKLDLIKIWMHIGQVKIAGKKMSKSLDNYILIDDILKCFHEEYIKFFLLSTHYRYEINYSFESVKKSSNVLNSLYKVLLNLKGKKIISRKFKNKFFKALENDFNTPKAISILFEIANRIKEEKTFSFRKHKLMFTLKFLGNVLGILKYNASDFLGVDRFQINSSIIKKLIIIRTLARKKKKWKLADKIREKLLKLGVKIVDEKII